jgi:hypothetical protein
VILGAHRVAPPPTERPVVRNAGRDVPLHLLDGCRLGR